LKLKILKKLKTASLNLEFTGSYNKKVYSDWTASLEAFQPFSLQYLSRNIIT